MKFLLHKPSVFVLIDEKEKKSHHPLIISHYIMAGHAIVVVKDINLLFYHGNAVILTLW